MDTRVSVEGKQEDVNLFHKYIERTLTALPNALEPLKQSGFMDKVKKLYTDGKQSILYEILEGENILSPCEICYFIEHSIVQYKNPAVVQKFFSKISTLFGRGGNSRAINIPTSTGNFTQEDTLQVLESIVVTCPVTIYKKLEPRATSIMQKIDEKLNDTRAIGGGRRRTRRKLKPTKK